VLAPVVWQHVHAKLGAVRLSALGGDSGQHGTRLRGTVRAKSAPITTTACNRE